jgi:class 3 adenylate cyclase
MTETALQVAKLRRALDEVLDQRAAFTEEAFTQLLLAIYDKIRVLQTTTEIQQPSSQDEIRLVTIMFVDIVDSTRMTLTLKADEWKATVGDAHNQVAALIHKHSGEVGQYLGDGVLC